MTGYTKVSTIETHTNRSVKVDIVKYQKDGTKRQFFVAEFEGKRIGTTLFARMYDAVKIAKRYVTANA